MKKIPVKGGFTLVELLISITILGIIGIAFATMFATAGSIFRESVQEERFTQQSAALLNDVLSGSHGDITVTPVDGYDGTTAIRSLTLDFIADSTPMSIAIDGQYYDAVTSEGKVLRIFSPASAPSAPTEGE